MTYETTPGSPASQPPPPPSYGRFEPHAPPEAAKPSQAMAWWALGLACLPCGFVWLVGAVLGVLTLRKGRDGRNHGKKKAIAAIVVAVLWVALLGGALLSGGFLPDTDRSVSGEATSTGQVSVYRLRVGDCLRDTADEGFLTTVTVTPCASPHRGEVFGEFDLQDGSFPGLAGVERLAEGGCVAQMPTSLRDSPESAQVVYLYPQSTSSFRADRGVTCIAFFDAPVSGLVAGPDRGALS